jgi:L,D-transpeptidase ErfK/SrfK
VKVRSSLGVALVACTLASPGLIARDPSGRLVGQVGRHVVQAGESLRLIGARYGVDATTIAEDNALGKGAAPAPGRELIVDNRHIVPAAALDGVIVVNVPQRMLFFRDGNAVFSAAVAVGSRGWQTPLAPFEVRTKETDPTWDVPASIAAEARAKGRDLPSRVPPGPTNPLGRHWLGLTVGSVGIHGTNAPASIYGAVTHGCIRVHPDDVAVLFDLVDIGTPGVIVYEPILLAEENGEIYLEVHPDAYGRLTEPPLQAARSLAAAMGIADRIDWAAAGQVVQRQHGIARPVTAR